MDKMYDHLAEQCSLRFGLFLLFSIILNLLILSLISKYLWKAKLKYSKPSIYAIGIAGSFILAYLISDLPALHKCDYFATKGLGAMGYLDSMFAMIVLLIVLVFCGGLILAEISTFLLIKTSIKDQTDINRPLLYIINYLFVMAMVLICIIS